MVDSAIQEMVGNPSFWSHAAISARSRPNANARMKNMDDLLEKHRHVWSRPLRDGGASGQHSPGGNQFTDAEVTP